MKYAGKIAFAYYAADPNEPGIIEEHYEERMYLGDVQKKRYSISNASVINSTIKARTTISIMADRYALTHYGYIRWVEYSGQKWSVESVEQAPPRLLLELGAVYNENGGDSNGTS